MNLDDMTAESVMLAKLSGECLDIGYVENIKDTINRMLLLRIAKMFSLKNGFNEPVLPFKISTYDTQHNATYIMKGHYFSGLTFEQWDN